MGSIKKYQTGGSAKPKLNLSASMMETKRKLDSTNKAIQKREERIAEAEKKKVKSSYTNERISKVLGKKTSYKRGGKITKAPKKKK
jgi:hypothetical protein